MVGTDKYSDEQITGILYHRNILKEDWQTIAAWCTTQWKNRPFFTSGIKYVYGKYKSIEE
jgi:hypothetical protein